MSNFVKLNDIYIDVNKILYYTSEFGDPSFRRVKVVLEGGVELEIVMSLIDFEKICFGRGSSFNNLG